MEILKTNEGTIRKDLEFFEKVYAKYYSRMIVFAASIVYDNEEAKDIVQEVFYYLWDNADDICIKSSLKNYLFTAVKNRAVNRIQQYRVHDAHKDQIRDAYLMISEFEPEMEEETIERLNRAIDELPEQMQKVVHLKGREGKKYEEIAHELGISINTVKTHLKRAFEILRGKLSTISVFILWLFN